jgi:hypothetical protein
MSKSRGTFIKARTYLDHLDPEYLRYYFAAKLGPNVEDIDLNLGDFTNRVNSDLVGKLVNIASRTASFISKRFDGRLGAELPDSPLLGGLLAAGDSIAEAYEKRELSRAMREVMALADRANQYIDEQAPWVMAKQPGREAELHRVCTLGLNLYRVLIGYLAPVLPRWIATVARVGLLTLALHLPPVPGLLLAGWVLLQWLGLHLALVRLGRRHPLPAPARLTLLRVFGAASFEDFAELIAPWRGVGLIEYLEGPDTIGQRDDVHDVLRFLLDEGASDILGRFPHPQGAADGQAHHKDFGLGAGLRCDHLQLMPGVHRVAELEMAGG